MLSMSLKLKLLKVTPLKPLLPRLMALRLAYVSEWGMQILPKQGCFGKDFISKVLFLRVLHFRQAT